MTEAEWLSGNDLAAMMAFMESRASERKRRLFACACLWTLRSRWELDDRRFIQRSESEADGRTVKEVHAQYVSRGGGGSSVPLYPGWELTNLANFQLKACRFRYENKKACSAFREVFGNPFRPSSLDPVWLAWNDGAISKMAQAIYEERAFDRMPLFADALEEAGCDDQQILDHCRGGGRHVRGCWVVDLLLGKE